MLASSRTEAAAELSAERVNSDEHQGRFSCALPLESLDVLIVTSGHEAMDHRIYAKQACSLKKFGANVTVVGFRDGDARGPVPVLAVPKPASRLKRFIAQPWRCLWAARRLNPEIIHFHDLEMLVTLPVAKLWWRRTKFIYDVHEDFGNLMAIRDWLPAGVKPFVRFLTNRVEKSLALLADAIVGVTPPLTAKFSNENKITAYNYNPREFFERAGKTMREPRNRAFDLVHLGTLNSRRAIFLADVIRELHRAKPSVRSLVIGLSPDIEKTMKSRIPEGCLLLGKTPYSEIPALLGNAKVGLDVHPWLTPHLEVALPVKVCEYMAAGCAVVSSSMPVLDQLLHQAGANKESVSIIKSEEPAAYANAVLGMIEKIESGTDPGAKVRQLASKHMVWEREAEKIARLYLSLWKRPCAA